VSKDDPNYGAKALSDIDVSLTPVVRTTIAKWTDDAYVNKMVRAKVDLGKLFHDAP